MKYNTKLELTKLYRVQGGKGYATSREMLIVTPSNTLKVPEILRKTYVGSEEHNRNFIPLRLNEKIDKYSAQTSSTETELEVIQMFFPKFFIDLLRKCSISEYLSTGKNPYAPPHTVDISKGEAYQMYGVWNLLMQVCCVSAEKVKIHSVEEAECLLYGKNEPSKFNPINISELKNYLHHASKESNIPESEIREFIEICETLNNSIKSRER